MASWAENWAALKLDFARLSATCAQVRSEVTGLVGRLREAFAAYPPVEDDEDDSEETGTEVPDLSGTVARPETAYPFDPQDLQDPCDEAMIDDIATKHRNGFTRLAKHEETT